jgi:hypothetical protein
MRAFLRLGSRGSRGPILRWQATSSRRTTSSSSSPPEGGGPESEIEDNKRLLAGYSSLDAFFTLFTNAGAKNAMNLHNKAVINLEKDPIASILCYVDLLNPLLKKYNFVPQEFLRGSREAFRQINLAIGSKELRNFANGFVPSSPVNDLLKISVSPKIYDACLTAQKVSSDIMAQTTLVKCEVMESELKSVKIKILEEGDVDGPPEAAVADDKPLSPPASTGTTNFYRGATEQVLAKYPAGALAAIVDVQFTAKEFYVSSMPTGEDVHHERVTHQVWTFVGHLSGDLDWVASQFRFVNTGPL